MESAIFPKTNGSSEKILWQGAKGEVGAFLTNERLLAVSIRSGQWNIRYLKIIEKKEPPDMLIAAHLVIMLTGERIVTFGTHTGGFVQTRLPIGESVVAKEAEGRVAAVVTPSPGIRVLLLPQRRRRDPFSTARDALCP